MIAQMISIIDETLHLSEDSPKAPLSIGISHHHLQGFSTIRSIEVLKQRFICRNFAAVAHPFSVNNYPMRPNMLQLEQFSVLLLCHGKKTGMNSNGRKITHKSRYVGVQIDS